MLMLRLEQGLNLDLCTAKTGIDAGELFGEAVDRLSAMNLVCREKNSVLLTRKGIAVADAVAAEFVDVE